MNIDRQKLMRAALIAAPFLLIIILFLSVLLFMEPAEPLSNSSSLPSIPTDTHASSPASSTLSETVSETKAVWISFLEMQKILKGKSESQYTKSISEYFNNIKAHGFNTVIFHARSHGDAFYQSSLFPTSVHFTVTRKKEANFDPLAIAVQEAHKRGLIIEAWVNPYRGPQIEDDEPLEPNSIFAKWLNTRRVFITSNGENTYHYFNPADPDVQEYVLDGVSEILNNYDIDGIHFDDYFYPTTAEWVDSEEYQKYGGGLTLDEFRRKSVSDFVAKVYKTVKAKGKTFGISPAGNIKSNVNSYYADVELWGSREGYVDYLMPQLYWSYGEGALPFETALKQWNKLVSCDRVMLKVGLGAYKVGTNEYWDAQNILSRQINDSKSCKNYAGFALFRYENVFSSQCAEELKNIIK